MKTKKPFSKTELIFSAGCIILFLGGFYIFPSFVMPNPIKVFVGFLVGYSIVETLIRDKIKNEK